MPLDFNISAEDYVLIERIAQRTFELCQTLRIPIPYWKHEIIMDLTLAHKDIPMRLEELLVADNHNFGHDVFGIYRHLNRETGKIDDCFRPRYSA